MIIKGIPLRMTRLYMHLVIKKIIELVFKFKPNKGKQMKKKI